MRLLTATRAAWPRNSPSSTTRRSTARARERRAHGRPVSTSPGRPERGLLAREMNPATRVRASAACFVRGALDQARAGGRTVIPDCPFTAAYIRRHPDTPTSSHRTAPATRSALRAVQAGGQRREDRGQHRGGRRARCAMSPASASPSIRPREAVARIEIGLTLDERLEPAGQRLRLDEDVADRNVSGKMPMKPAFMTAFGERSSSPSVVNTHDRPNAKTTPARAPRRTPGDARRRAGSRGSRRAR